jgi:zinc protease
MLVWHGPKAYTAGDAELDVLAYILAGSEDARLTRRLVHEARAAESVEASQWSGRWQSQFVIDATVAPNRDLASVTTMIDEELAAIGGPRPPTAEEVAKAVRNLEVDALREVETLLGRAERLQQYRMMVGKTDYINEDLARYRAVTPESVAAAARSLLPENRARLTVSPKVKSP